MKFLLTVLIAVLLISGCTAPATSTELPGTRSSEVPILTEIPTVQVVTTAPTETIPPTPSPTIPPTAEPEKPLLNAQEWCLITRNGWEEEKRNAAKKT